MLYTPAAKFSGPVLNRIAKAGYLAVPVDSFDAVKIIDQIPVGGVGAVSRAAFDAIAAAGAHSPVPEDFGRRLAATLGTQPSAR